MKNEKVKVAVFSSLATLIICIMLFFIFPNTGRITPPGVGDYNTHFAEIQAYIDKYSIFDFDNEIAYSNASYGYLYGVSDDRYLGFFSAEEYKSYIEDSKGEFTGIGVQFYYSDDLSDGLLIWQVVGDSPAEKAGLRSGDLLIEIDYENIEGKTYYDVLDMLQKEEGATSEVTVLRGNEQLDFSLTWENFVRRDVSYYIADNYIGVITINEFTENVYSQFKTALEEISAAGAQGIIFDLRNNPGGNLSTVCDIVDMLVPAGSEIAYIEYKDSVETIYAKTEPIIDMPFVVLVNRSSASAAELFASSLRDILGTKLVGEKTFGKGVGQQTFILSDNSAIKLTTFKYYTKSRTDYNNIGLEPDYIVEMNLSEYKSFYSMQEDEDRQKQKAIEVMKTLISEKGIG